MKRVFITLFIVSVACISLASSCIKNYDKSIQPDNIKYDTDFVIKQVGSHQYLIYHNGERGGICHYEDCSNPKCNKKKLKSENYE